MENFNSLHDAFLKLVRLGIGTGTVQDVQKFKSLSHEGWKRLKDLADKQGLTALVLDGLDALKSSNSLRSSSRSSTGEAAETSAEFIRSR